MARQSAQPSIQSVNHRVQSESLLCLDVVSDRGFDNDFDSIRDFDRLFYRIAWPAEEGRQGWGRLLTEARVVASFGGPFLRFGGAFYRFTLYENYLVVCFMTARSYAYKDVHFQKSFNNGGDSLALLLNDTPVTLHGNRESLARISVVLSKNVASSRTKQ